MTRDIDIVVNVQSSDLSKFLAIFKEGYYIHPPTVEEEINRKIKSEAYGFPTWIVSIEDLVIAKIK